jgi:hypothetical protein
MVIIPSSSCLQFQLTQAFEYSTITQHFMITNHPIMLGHFPHQNSIKQRIKHQLNGQFAALFIHVFSLPPSPIKGGMDSPLHHTPALKQYSSHSHPQQSKETPSTLPANFVQPHSPQFTASFLMI